MVRFTKPKSSPAKNLAIVGGLVAIIAGFGLFPFYITEKRREDNLRLKKEGLTGSQAMRGPYVNSSSNDIGADPDWDPQTGEYRGLSSKKGQVPEEVLEQWRKQLGDNEKSYERD